MSHSTFCGVLFRFHLGIEQARLLNGSGPQNKFSGIAGTGEIVLPAEGTQVRHFSGEDERILDLPDFGRGTFQRNGGEDCANASPYDVVHDCGRLVRAPLGSAQIIAMPALRDRFAGNALSGVQHRPAEQLRVLHLIRVNIGGQWFHSFLIGLQPTYMPQVFP